MLSEVCAITMGQAPSGESYNHRGEGLPLIAGAGDFKGDLITPSKFTTQPIKLSSTGDIVLAIRASIGAKVWVDRVYCLGRGVAGLRPGPRLDSRFLWHWLTYSERELAGKGRGATFLQVNRNDIGEMLIDLPTVAEQRRIAAILDQADALRAKRRQILAHLDTLTQSIFHGTAHNGPITSHTFGSLVKYMRNGLSPSTGGSVLGTVLTLSAVTRGAFDATASKPATFGAKPGETVRVDARDFLICRGNGNKSLVGVGVHPPVNRHELVFPDTVIASRIAVERVDPTYLEAVWRQPATRRQIESVARTTNGTYKINQQNLSSVVVCLPRRDHQRVFAAHVGRINAQRTAMAPALSADDELFGSLQPRSTG